MQIGRILRNAVECFEFPAPPVAPYSAAYVLFRELVGYLVSLDSVMECGDLEAEFVQKRSKVCKFAGKASVDGKVTCEVQFTAMIADAPE